VASLGGPPTASSAPNPYRRAAPPHRSMRLRDLASLSGLTAVMEKVGTYVPGNHVGYACTFARHCGHLEAALYTLGSLFTEVELAVWMKSLGALPKDKRERKRAIPEEMARRHPSLHVTLMTGEVLACTHTRRY
jgi:hypothetical protein